MTSNKKTAQEQQQAQQFSQLLKDYGITGQASHISSKDRKKIEEIFPD